MRKILTLWFFTFCNLTSAQIIDFPDANFKNALVNTKCVDVDGDWIFDADADLNNDGEIDVIESLMVVNLRVSNANIASLIGINNFINLKGLECEYNFIMELDVTELKKLEYLNCRYNKIINLSLKGIVTLKNLYCSHNKINALDLSGFKTLENLFCDSNTITELDVNDLSNLTNLNCSRNFISSLDVSGLKNLRSLKCIYNKLTTLDLRELINLGSLSCSYNELIELKVEGLTNLTELDCSSNLLTSIEVKSLTNLRYELDCSFNKLSTLDIRGLNKLENLSCEYNNLRFLFIKTTSNFLKVSFYNNIDLEYICCNEIDYNRIVERVQSLNLTNCIVDSECSVTNTQDLYTNINTYPNPVSDILYLDTNENWTKAEIFDIAGRIMRSVNLHSSSMDVSDLQSGTYFIRLKDGERVGLVKFVKI